MLWPVSALASPVGTPAANRPPTGKARSLDHMFDGLAEPKGKKADPAGPPRERSNVTAAEWRVAYIAKHHHDLPSLAHPGH
jgi:hypothetical protein